MDCIGTCPLGRLEEPRNGEVALGRRPRTEEVRLVGDAYVQCAAVGLGVDGDGPDPELTQRAEDADRDLASVRDEHLSERRHTGAYSPPRWDSQTS